MKTIKLNRTRNVTYERSIWQPLRNFSFLIFKQMNSFGTSLSLIQPSINLFAIFQFLIRNDKFECDSDLAASTFLLYYIIWIF